MVVKLHINTRYDRSRVVKSAMFCFPIAGSMLRSISRHTLSAWPTNQCLLLACQSRATFSKVLSVACSCCLISSFGIGADAIGKQKADFIAFFARFSQRDQGICTACSSALFAFIAIFKIPAFGSAWFDEIIYPKTISELVFFSRGFAVRAAKSVIAIIGGSKVYRSEVPLS